MGKLDTLKLAAFVIKDLKYDERALKQTLVKAASCDLYALKTGLPYTVKTAGIGDWITGADSTSAPGVGKYDTRTMFGKINNMIGRGLHKINNNWGRDAVAEYANSKRFSDNPEERDKYLQNASESWYGNKLENLQDIRDLANKQRDSYRNRIANAMAQQDKDVVRDKEKYMDTEEQRMLDSQKRLMDKQDELYNNSELYGGSGGLGYHSGGPAGHNPRMYGPGMPRMAGGRAIGGYGGRGMYGGYGYGGYGMYGPRGSIYARGGYGGRGYGGYGGYGYGGYGGYRMPAPGSYPGHRRTWE